MPDVKLSSIDEYESYLALMLKGWSPQQRLAFAAGMAERWLPAYMAFSKAEEWGDAEGLRRSVDAVWAHLAGRRLSGADGARHLKLLADSTPHMDDFDALDALVAASLVSEALNACGTDNNHRYALGAGLAGFEVALPEEEMDDESQPRLWRKIAARRELKGQLALIDAIAAVTRFDEASLGELRRKIGELHVQPAEAQPKAPAGPTPLTNQASFEYYRRSLEGPLQAPPPQAMESNDAASAAIQVFSEWAGRYMSRLGAFQGDYGRLSDTTGWRRLAARHQAHDAAETGEPNWETLAGEIIEMCYQGNRSTGLLDTATSSQPHSYGPSLRRLWVEGKRLALSDRAAAQRIIDWAHHRPAAWEAEDLRKKKGRGQASPALGAALGQAVTWLGTGDLDMPWTAEVAGARWQVRLNDFPDEIMYSLIVDGVAAGDFHDWPETWQRD
jgi:hypothetical protein